MLRSPGLFPLAQPPLLGLGDKQQLGFGKVPPWTLFTEVSRLHLRKNKHMKPYFCTTEHCKRVPCFFQTPNQMISSV